MENLKSISETKHSELLTLLDPLVDFMVENNYSYFLVAGKYGTCTRHMRGKKHDVSEMISGMAENNSDVKEILEYCFNENKAV